MIRTNYHIMADMLEMLCHNNGFNQRVNKEYYYEDPCYYHCKYCDGGEDEKCTTRIPRTKKDISNYGHKKDCDYHKLVKEVMAVLNAENELIEERNKLVENYLDEEDLIRTPYYHFE